MNKKLMGKNNNKTISSGYKPYITGLKGLACVMVMIGHYLGVFVYAEKLPVDQNIFLAWSQSKAGFVLDEEYWLYLFFIISGYLVAVSKIDNARDLFAKYIQRFLRLGLPIMFAYAIVFIIYALVGFRNGETSALFVNTWFQEESFTGDFPVWKILTSPIDVLILGKESLIAPYWVLRDMFVASLMIYTATYLMSKAFVQKHGGSWLIPLLLLAVSVVISLVTDNRFILSCVAGSMLCWCEKNIDTWKKSPYIYVAILLVLLLTRALNRRYFDLLFFMALILYIPRISFLNRILSSGIAEFTGKISFGIYSFHWPIYCSFGALLMIDFIPRIGLIEAVLLAMLVSCAMTVVLSWLYHITCERFAEFLTKKIYLLLRMKKVEAQ